MPTKRKARRRKPTSDQYFPKDDDELSVPVIIRPVRTRVTLTPKRRRKKKSASASIKPVPDILAALAGMDMLGLALVCGGDPEKITKAAKKLSSDLERCAG